MAIDYAVLGGIATFFGIMFTCVWKIWDFIIKRTDKEIDEIILKFNEIVIKDNLMSIKQEQSITASKLNELRDNLNLPLGLNNLRKETHKTGKTTFALLIFSSCSAIFSILFPAMKLWEIPFLVLPVILTTGFFLYFFQYWQSLSELREYVEKIEQAIQDKKSIL